MGTVTSVRLAVIRVLVVSLLLTLGARLYYLQVLDEDKLVQTANRQHTREVILAAPRGTIVDDRGRPLVTNRSSLVVSVNRSALQAQADGGEAVLQRLGTLLNVAPAELAKRITPCATGRAAPVLERLAVPAGPGGHRHHAGGGADDRGAAGGLRRGQRRLPDPPAVPERQPGRALARLRRPGQPGRARRRPQAGRTDLNLNAQIGRAGLEKTYDADLRGKDGVRYVTVDNRGTLIGTQRETEPSAATRWSPASTGTCSGSPSRR